HRGTLTHLEVRLVSARARTRTRRRALGLFVVAGLSLLTVLVLMIRAGTFSFLSSSAASGSTSTPGSAPRALTGTISDMLSSKPIENAEVTASGILTGTGSDGRFYFEDVAINSKISVVADGYAGVEMNSGTGSQVDVKLRPNTVSGRVTDATT